MWIYLIAGVVYGFAAGAQPGPFIAYLVSLSLKQGFRRTLPAVFAPLISDTFIVAITLFALSKMPPALLRWLHLAGGALVLYLAWGAWKSWRDYKNPTAAEGSVAQGVLKATMVNLLNPNAYLGWSLVLGPLVLRAWRTAPRYATAVVGGFYLALFGATIAVVLLIDFARGMGQKVARAMIAVSAMALACMGLYQLWLYVSFST
jgi:threonine/homoserine/homoserine lactone efflux protein